MVTLTGSDGFPVGLEISLWTARFKDPSVCSVRVVLSLCSSFIFYLRFSSCGKHRTVYTHDPWLYRKCWVFFPPNDPVLISCWTSWCFSQYSVTYGRVGYLRTYHDNASWHDTMEAFYQSILLKWFEFPVRIEQVL